MRIIQLLSTAWLMLGFIVSVPAQAQYGPTRLQAQGQPFSYPTVAYSQSVVCNVSKAYENVVNFHWKKGDGTHYVVLAGRYLQRAPYNGIYPTPYPPFSPGPAGPGNGYMNASSRLPTYAAGDEVAPYLLKTGDYTANPADTTAQLLNASPGETYYAYIWEYTVDGNGEHVLPAPPGSNLSWQALFTQLYPLPQITNISLDSQNHPVVTWTTAAEDTVAGFRILLADDSTTTNGTLSGVNRRTMFSTVTPNGFATSVSTYSQTMPDPLNNTTWFQIVVFLTDKSTYVPGAGLWSPPQRLVPTTPLPVTLVDFTARRRRPAHGAVDVTWKTASELNNAGFELQRSSNGVTWQPLWFVGGNATSSQAHSYSTSDSCRTAAYYRLAQLDFNGTETFSPVRYVGAASGEAFLPPLALYPNPAQGLVHLSGADQALPLLLLNSLGQVVRQLPAGTESFDVARLPRGLYLLQQAGRQAKLILQ